MRWECFFDRMKCAVIVMATLMIIASMLLVGVSLAMAEHIDELGMYIALAIPWLLMLTEVDQRLLAHHELRPSVGPILNPSVVSGLCLRLPSKLRHHTVVSENKQLNLFWWWWGYFNQGTPRWIKIGKDEYKLFGSASCSGRSSSIKPCATEQQLQRKSVGIFFCVFFAQVLVKRS